MAKYTLNTYGWSFEAICKTLTDEQVQLIKDKMDEKGFTELNDTMTFQVVDEEGTKVLEFGIDETADLYETIEDFDDKYKYRSYNAIPEYNIPPTNLYLSVDENKGGNFTYTFESDTVPVASDFTYSSGSIDTPDGDYDFIDQVFFKGNPLEIEDYIDNWGKASSCMIYTLDGDTIN
jgi:hypothetical protein